MRFGDVPEEGFHPFSANERYGSEIWVWPIDVNGIERRWRFARDTVETIKDELAVVEVKGILNIQRAKKFYTRKTVWNDAKYSANVHGTQLLAQIMKSPFTFPKSMYLVLHKKHLFI